MFTEYEQSQLDHYKVVGQGSHWNGAPVIYVRDSRKPRVFKLIDAKFIEYCCTDQLSERETKRFPDSVDRWYGFDHETMLGDLLLRAFA